MGNMLLNIVAPVIFAIVAIFGAIGLVILLDRWTGLDWKVYYTDVEEETKEEGSTNANNVEN